MKNKNPSKPTTLERLKYPFLAVYIVAVLAGLLWFVSLGRLDVAVAGLMVGVWLLLYIVNSLSVSPQGINYPEMISDVRAGMHDRDLMSKHGLSRKGLTRVLKNLVSKGSLKSAEIDGQVRFFRKSARTWRKLNDKASSRTFPCISPYAFMHPIDAYSTTLLRSFPVMNFVLGKMAEFGYEVFLKSRVTSNCLKVTADDFGHIHDMLVHCVAALDLETVPEVYLTDDPLPNAWTAGTESPIIVLNVGLLPLFDDDELHAVLAHEIGHIKCHHVLYHTVTSYLTYLARLSLQFVTVIPFSRTFTLALLGWQRASELSADRAAVIITGNESAPVGVLRKISESVQIALRESAGTSEPETDTYSDWLARKVNGWMAEFDSTHPFLPRRIAEIELWASSGRYEAILDGRYPKISDRQIRVLKGLPRDQFGDLAAGTMLQLEAFDRAKQFMKRIERLFKKLYGSSLSLPQIGVSEQISMAEVEKLWDAAGDFTSEIADRFRTPDLGNIINVDYHLKKAKNAGEKILRNLKG